MPVQGALSVKTVTVPHLTHSKIGYYAPKPIVGSKPTLLLIAPGMSTADSFRAQFSDPELAEKVNLVALEPLGHGSSSTKNPQYTLWNSAIAFSQVMDALGIKSAIVLGDSLGGAIAARLALHAPSRVLGVILIGSNLSSGSRVHELGGQNMDGPMIELLKQITSPNESFAPPEDFLKGIAEASFGPGFDAEKTLQVELMKRDYSGEQGRKRFRQVAISMISRDSLHLRLSDLTVPVLWIRGDKDALFSEALVKDDIAQLVNADVQLKTIAGAYHLPNWSHPTQVNPLLFEFVKKHSGIKDARALREAVGMVDM